MEDSGGIKSFSEGNATFMREELKKPLLDAVRILGIALVVYLILRFLLPLVVPFLVALFLAKLLHPMIEKLHKKTRIKEGLLSSLILIILLAALGWVLWFVGKNLVIQLQGLFANFPMYQEKAGVFWNDCCTRVESWTGIQAEELNGRVMDTVPRIWENMKGTLLPALMSGSFSWVKGIFVLVGVCIVVMISTLLMMKEYGRMKEALERGRLGQALLRILRRVYRAGGGYFKAQLVIMLAVSGICVAGLFCAGNSYALLAGVGIGLCDAMPFLGTGTIFIPWALIELLQGEYMLAAIYAVIYTIASLARELMEPKPVGDKLGMPPHAVIISVYVGLQIYGLWGILLGPLSYILIREIWREGFEKDETDDFLNGNI